ncbi:MAG: NAD(P)-dependent oxidoreductase [Chitinophagales bacterium]
MKYRVLISAPYLLNDIEQFRNELANKNIEIDVYPVSERLEEEDLLPIIAQYDGIICGDDRFTKKVLDAAKTRLKVIVKWGTGIDSIDKSYAESIGIKVKNTLNAFTEPVSDSILALLLAFTRRIFESDRIMKSGNWEKAFGLCLSEVTIGIIGLGNIGTATARKLVPFNTKVYGNDIIDIDKGITNSLNIEMVPLEELLKKSDYIAICCDLNPTSKHLVNKTTIDKMKDGVVLINTSRGPIIKEDDLISAIQSGKIKGVGLDVFEDEPLSIDSALRKMNNAILSSHNVNASPFHWNKVHRNSLNMLYDILGV